MVCVVMVYVLSMKRPAVVLYFGLIGRTRIPLPVLQWIVLGVFGTRSTVENIEGRTTSPNTLHRYSTESQKWPFGRSVDRSIGPITYTLNDNNILYDHETKRSAILQSPSSSLQYWHFFCTTSTATTIRFHRRRRRSECGGHQRAALCTVGRDLTTQLLQQQPPQQPSSITTIASP